MNEADLIIRPKKRLTHAIPDALLYTGMLQPRPE
jgi:hypothetical protein